MTTYELLVKEKEHLDAVIRIATTFLKDAPNGRITIKKMENRSEYYLYPGGKYLSLRRNKVLIKNLIQKSYEKKVLKAAIEQRDVIEKFLTQYNPNALSSIVEKWDSRRIDMLTLYEDFCKCMPEATTEEVSETDSGVDLARNLIAICEAFLQSKGGSL